MEWIDREEVVPDCDKILGFDKGNIFIFELIESKWGNFYCSTDWSHKQIGGHTEWSHWMPLPDPPKPDSPTQD